MCEIQEYCQRNKPKQLYNMVDIIKSCVSNTSQGDTTVLDNINARNFIDVCKELLEYLDNQED
jgi:hypothetical protein